MYGSLIVVFAELFAVVTLYTFEFKYLKKKKRHLTTSWLIRYRNIKQIFLYYFLSHRDLYGKFVNFIQKYYTVILLNVPSLLCSIIHNAEVCRSSCV